MGRKRKLNLSEKEDIFGLYYNAPELGKCPSADDLGRMFKCSQTTIFNAIKEIIERKRKMNESTLLNWATICFERTKEAKFYPDKINIIRDFLNEFQERIKMESYLRIENKFSWMGVDFGPLVFMRSEGEDGLTMFGVKRARENKIYLGSNIDRALAQMEEEEEK